MDAPTAGAGTEERAGTQGTRGFVWWALSLLLLVLYVVWTVLPTRAELAASALCAPRGDGVLCQAALLSVYVIPDAYWITAVPALLVVLVLLAAVGYCGVMLRTGAPPTARAAWRSRGEPPHGAPTPARTARHDVPLQAVSAALHLRPARGTRAPEMQP